MKPVEMFLLYCMVLNSLFAYSQVKAKTDSRIVNVTKIYIVQKNISYYFLLSREQIEPNKAEYKILVEEKKSGKTLKEYTFYSDSTFYTSFDKLSLFLTSHKKNIPRAIIEDIFLGFKDEDDFFDISQYDNLGVFKTNNKSNETSFNHFKYILNWYGVRYFLYCRLNHKVTALKKETYKIATKKNLLPITSASQ